MSSDNHITSASLIDFMCPKLNWLYFWHALNQDLSIITKYNVVSAISTFLCHDLRYLIMVQNLVLNNDN